MWINLRSFWIFLSKKFAANRGIFGKIEFSRHNIKINFMFLIFLLCSRLRKKYCLDLELKWTHKETSNRRGLGKFSIWGNSTKTGIFYIVEKQDWKNSNVEKQDWKNSNVVLSICLLWWSICTPTQPYCVLEDFCSNWVTSQKSEKASKKKQQARNAQGSAAHKADNV